MRYCIAILAIALLAGGSTVSLAKDISFADPHGNHVAGVRCGTHVPTPDEAAYNYAEVQAWLKAGGRINADKADVVIPMAIHVIRMDDGSCDVPDAQIYAQLDVLNAAYQGTGFSFSVASIDRYDNTRWSTARYGSRQASDMKASTAIDPASNFNVWFANIGGGLLGYATFPDMYPEDSYMHGVVALYSTVPGGTAAPYNEGDTLTHEAGHYLGLYHTFQDGCTEPNDYCDDTPQEASPAYGCPEGRDTCPTAGLDPITNFMDYVDDYCMYEFTADQSTRMHEQVGLYRPTIYGGVVPPTGPTAAFTGSPTGGDYPLAVQFTDQSTGDPTSWSWSFGDGGTSTVQSPGHTYTAAGTYNVSLTVSNADGSDTLTKTGYITVTEPGTGGGAMHVADIVVSRVQSGRKYYGRAVVTIVDDGGAPVAGATVSGTFTGDATEAGSGVTGADGTVTMQTAKKYYGTNEFCFEVTGVALTGTDYDAAANVVTKACESGDVFRRNDDTPLISLGNNPNPFNPITVIEFEMARASHVVVRIYDARGRLVDTPVEGVMGSGFHAVTWDARDRASGVYFCQLETGGKVQTSKMTLLK